MGFNPGPSFEDMQDQARNYPNLASAAPCVPKLDGSHDENLPKGPRCTPRDQRFLEKLAVSMKESVGEDAYYNLAIRLAEAFESELRITSPDGDAMRLLDEHRAQQSSWDPR